MAITDVGIAPRPTGILVTWWDGPNFYDRFFDGHTQVVVQNAVGLAVQLLAQQEKPPSQYGLVEAWVLAREEAQRTLATLA
jgi:hypothetical protein